MTSCNFSDTFTLENLQAGIKLSKTFKDMSVQEAPADTQEELVEKYQSLKNLKCFIENLKHTNQKYKDSGLSNHNKVLTQYIKNIALNADRMRPIMDDDGKVGNQKEDNLNGLNAQRGMFARDDEFFSKILNYEN